LHNVRREQKYNGNLRGGNELSKERLEEVQLRFINGEKVTKKDMMYVFEQAERV